MLSILIVNWNTRDLLRACLASLVQTPISEPSEIIVVDNASTDGSAEMTRKEFPQVRLLEPGKNTGYAKGNNLAFSVASGDFLLTLNPDTEITDDTLDRAVALLKARSDLACVAPRQLGLDGKTQRSVRGFPNLVGIFGDLVGLGRKLPGSKWDSYRLTGFDYESAQYAPQPMGTFLMFSRKALERVGDPKAPFDEAFPIFFNEVDLLYRLHHAGLRCWYDPSLSILHHGGEGTKQVRKAMIWESHRSLVGFLRKHAKSPLRRGIVALASVAIYAAALVRAKGYSGGFRA